MHIVHRIRIETRVGGGSLGRKVDRVVAGMVEDHLPKRLEECFEQVSGGRSLRIETMEIDLGELSFAEFERGFVERVTASVMAKIRPEALRPDVEIGKQGEQPSAGERVEAWVYFLRRGHLPWWFADARWDEISSLRELHAADPERVIDELGKLAAGCPEALVRLARHATAEDLAEVFGGSARAIEFEKIAESGGALDAIAAWLGGLAGGQECFAKMLPLLSLAEREELALPSWFAGERESPGARKNPGNHAGRMISLDPMDPAEAFPSSFPEFRNGSLSGDAGLPVGTAGLVLLHPFLGRLFRHLGWLDEAGGMNGDFRWHAVQALQFLALGRCGLPEATLVLEKTLCGILLHEVAEFPALDEAARRECEELLEAVIGHWSVLGKTSVGGLRESFLTRSGLLFFEESRVRLAVERRPFDMLLGKLPWPLGPVMFGWLKQPVFVKWEGGES